MRMNWFAFGLLAVSPALLAQSVVSVKAGVVHYVEGDVTLGDAKSMAPVETRLGGKITEMKEGQQLATAEGRAEVLLTPGVVLRLGENSAIRMISNRLIDTRVELLSGVALVEVSDGLNIKDTAVTLLVNDASVTLTKMALVRLDAKSGIRVYKGEAQILAGGTPNTLREGRELQFGAGNLIARFDPKQTDPLYRWANRRAEYIAMANISAARMAQRSGNTFAGGWVFNPYFGMYTYLPLGNGLFRTPFGYAYYSPTRVYRYYEQFMRPSAPVYANAGGSGIGRGWSNDHGYVVTSQREAASVSSAGGYVNSGSAGAAPAASAPAPTAGGRGADVSTGRGGASTNGN